MFLSGLTLAQNLLQPRKKLEPDEINFSQGFSQKVVSISCLYKGVRALRDYFGPSMRPKNEIRFSLNSSYWFIRTMTQVYKSDISLTFTVAMVTKMAAKTG